MSALVVAVALSVVGSVRQLADAQQSQAVSRAETLARFSLQPSLRPSALSAPSRSPAGRALARTLRREIAGWPVARVVVWRPDGTVLASTDQALSGIRFAAEPPLRAAWKGRVGSGPPVVAVRAAAGGDQGVLAVYVPVRAPGAAGSAPGLVVEIDERLPGPSPLRVAEASVWPLGALAVLFGALALLWGLATRDLRRTQRVAGEQVRWLTGRHNERRDLLEATVGAVEDERARIARELHDGPVQHLTGVGFLVERAAMAVEAGDAAKAIEVLEQAGRRLSGEVENLRRLMVEARPPVLDERGLAPSVAEMTRTVCDEAGIAGAVEVTLTETLDPEVETVLYRVAEEALRNAIRHARASRIAVALVGRNRAAVLEVRDNGIGFRPSAPGRESRVRDLGLLGMRERVEGVGGRFELQSRWGGGTTVRAVVPLGRTAPGAARRPGRHAAPDSVSASAG